MQLSFVDYLNGQIQTASTPTLVWHILKALMEWSTAVNGKGVS